MKDQQDKKNVNRPQDREDRQQEGGRTSTQQPQREVSTQFDRENRQGGRGQQPGSRNPQGQGSRVEDVGPQELEREQLGSEPGGRERSEDRDRDRSRSFQQPPAGKNK